MADLLRRYRELDYALPKTYLAWELYGAGLDNLGRDGKPAELPLRDPEPDEVLLRVDALGLCFSDVKLTMAGAEHPRIRGRDLVNDPTVPGHEASLTVVKAGANWKNRFTPGQRYIIQADIYVKGEQKAFGYVQRGAFAQFAYAGPWVLSGDDGCYLLPLQEKDGYAEAALVEPWACVEAAYALPARTRAKAGGKLLVVGAGGAVDWAGLYAEGGPARVVTLGAKLVPPGAASGAVEHAGDAIAADAVKAAAEKAGGFDDIVLAGDVSGEVVSACDAALAQGGTLAFVSAAKGVAATLDIGRVHYHGTRHVGTTGARVADAYAANAREELKAGGKTWMVGAAGPMGQMHVQRALELPEPPKTLFCTDMSPERLAYMQGRLGPIAQRKGIDFRCVDVKANPDVDGAADACAAEGFDDVYVHAPVAPLVEQGSRHLARGAVENVFAGVGLGTMATFGTDVFFDRHARLIGSSGSPMSAIKSVLAKMEAGTLSTRMSLAALGGIGAVREGVRGLKENRFPGKTVIFPAVKGLDLSSLPDFAKARPDVAAKLEQAGIWTTEAEAAFLEASLSL